MAASDKAILGSKEFTILILFFGWASGMNLVVQQISSSAVAAEALLQQFQQFMLEYQKYYISPIEKILRFKIFKDNLIKIKELNAQQRGTAVFGIGPFADMTSTEFTDAYTMKIPKPKQRQRRATEELPKRLKILSNFTIPDEFTRWVDTEFYPPPENQNRFTKCESCWAFAAASQLEILFSLKRRAIVRLSKQQLVSCVSEADGCSGGRVSNALNYMLDYGITTEKEYPYTGKKGPCNDSARNVAQIKTFYTVKENVGALVQALMISPVVITLFAAPELQHYKTGIYETPICGTEEMRNHAALIVAYKEGAWIIRNSWGARWGVKGHFFTKMADSCFGELTVAIASWKFLPV